MVASLIFRSQLSDPADARFSGVVRVSVGFTGFQLSDNWGAIGAPRCMEWEAERPSVNELGGILWGTITLTRKEKTPTLK